MKAVKFHDDVIPDCYTEGVSSQLNRNQVSIGMNFLKKKMDHGKKKTSNRFVGS